MKGWNANITWDIIRDKNVHKNIRNVILTVRNIVGTITRYLHWTLTRLFGVLGKHE